VFKPVARRLLASEVFDQIRDRIVRGEMEPGSSLPAERVLATLLGVNRNAVREGLKRLQQAGLVAIQQGGATRVLDFRRSAGLELLATMVVGADGNLDTSVVRSIVELRTELAPVIGRFAARRATHEHVARLRAITTQMREAKDDGSALARLALDFWREVVSATDNLALELAFNSLEASYGTVIEQELRALDDYVALVDAIEACQPEKAAERARRIVARGEESIARITRVVDAFQGAIRRGEQNSETTTRPKRRRST
jgi:GntR family transcriptional repressor for pyruvate dehydrogenase complex